MPGGPALEFDLIGTWRWLALVTRECQVVSTAHFV
jgi:hypothetical protein